MIYKYTFLLSFLLHVSVLHAELNDKLIGMTIPLYSYPTDTQVGIGNMWDAVADAAKFMPMVVVVGVNSSEDTKADFIDGINKLHSSGATVLAYVATGLTVSEEDPKVPHDIAILKAEIDDFVNNFDIDGIFFDEALAFDELANGEDMFNYYEEITAYAKSYEKVKKVMLNISFVIKEDIVRSSSDDFVIFENYISNWDVFLASQYEGVSFRRLHIIVHGDNNSSGENYMDSAVMQAYLKDSVDEKSLVNVYFTDDEFHHLPSFWYDEVAEIRKYNNILKSSYLPIIHYLLN